MRARNLVNNFSHHLQLGSDMKPEEIKITPNMKHPVEEKMYFFLVLN